MPTISLANFTPGTFIDAVVMNNNFDILEALLNGGLDYANTTIGFGSAGHGNLSTMTSIFHSDDSIAVSNPNYSSTTLAASLTEISNRIGSSIHGTKSVQYIGQQFSSGFCSIVYTLPSTTGAVMNGLIISAGANIYLNSPVGVAGGAAFHATMSCGTLYSNPIFLSGMCHESSIGINYYFEQEINFATIGYTAAADLLITLTFYDDDNAGCTTTINLASLVIKGYI